MNIHIIYNIDTSRFVLKSNYDTDKSDLKNKIPDTNGLIEKIYNSKTTEIEGKIPSISSFATTSALTTVKRKIPNVSSLVKRTDYNTKINKIEDKITDQINDEHVTTPEFNKLTAEHFAA